MKIKIKSPANIAFIKYWGQRDKDLILPYNDSFSMNLSSCYTQLEVEYLFSKDYYLWIKNYQEKDYCQADKKLMEKIMKYYQKTKAFFSAKNDFGFRIYSQNSFPIKAGIASSASFYSALAVAFAYGFLKKLPNKKTLSILARLSGSGSACRSIPDGFSWWRKGKDSLSSYAYSIASPKFWDLVDMVLILNKKAKSIGSAEGHLLAETSPFFLNRIKEVKKRLKKIKKAFFEKNFDIFGQLLEEETLSMHMVMMTQKPPLYYLSGRTFEVMKKIVDFRSRKKKCYYTIDAGENIHLICLKKDKKEIYDYFINQKEIEGIIVNYPAEGTQIIK